MTLQAFILDSNPGFRNQLRTELRGFGIEVVETSGSEERCLESLEDKDLHFDLIVVDVSLSKSNIKSFISRARASSRNQNLLIYCTYLPESEAYLRGTFEVGINGALQKPFSAKVLAALIKQQQIRIKTQKLAPEVLFHEAQAKFYESRNQLPRAMEIFEATIKKFDADALLYFQAGRICLTLSERTTGEQFLSKACQLEPALEPIADRIISQYNLLQFTQSDMVSFGLTKNAYKVLYTNQSTFENIFFGKSRVTSILLLSPNSNIQNNLTTLLRASDLGYFEYYARIEDGLQRYSESDFSHIIVDSSNLDLKEFFEKFKTANPAPNTKIISLCQATSAEKLLQDYKLGIKAHIEFPTQKATLLSILHHLHIIDSFNFDTEGQAPLIRLAYLLSTHMGETEALEVAKQAEELNHENAALNIILGMCKFRKLGFEGANRHFNLALRYDENAGSAVARLRSLLKSISDQAAADQTIPIDSRNIVIKDDQDPSDKKLNIEKIASPSKERKNVSETPGGLNASSISNLEQATASSGPKIKVLDEKDPYSHSGGIKVIDNSAKSASGGGVVFQDAPPVPEAAVIIIEDESIPFVSTEHIKSLPTPNYDGGEILTVDELEPYKETSLTLSHQIKALGPRLATQYTSDENKQSHTNGILIKIGKAVAEIPELEQDIEALNIAAEFKKELQTLCRGEITEETAIAIAKITLASPLMNHILDKVSTYWQMGPENSSLSADTVEIITNATLKLKEELVVVSAEAYEGTEEFKKKFDEIQKAGIFESPCPKELIEDLLETDNGSLNSFKQIFNELKVNNNLVQMNMLAYQHRDRFLQSDSLGLSFGQFLADNNIHKHAFLVFRDLLSRKNLQKDTKVNFANSAYHVKKFNEVVGVCDTLESTEKDDNIFNLTGAAFKKLGDLEAAIKQYKEGLKINPDNYKLYFNLALAYASLGDQQAAIEYQKKAEALRDNKKD